MEAPAPPTGLESGLCHAPRAVGQGSYSAVQILGEEWRPASSGRNVRVCDYLSSSVVFSFQEKWKQPFPASQNMPLSQHCVTSAKSLNLHGP